MIASGDHSGDIVVTYEDQSKINKFASHNAKLEELRDELSLKEKEMNNIEDALKEVELLSISDETEVQLLEGEIFVKFNLDQAEEWILAKKKEVSQEVDRLREEAEQLKEEMNELKVALYSKFGRNNINLESDD